MTEDELLYFLTSNEISFTKIFHPAVFTSTESAHFLAKAPGTAGKNLFLQNRKGTRYFLVMTLGVKKVDLKRLAHEEGLGKLRFANADMLANKLGVSTGAVGPLALINDQSLEIEILADKDLWEEGVIRCHPLVNTTTLILKTTAIEKFFALTGHSFKLVEIHSIK